MTTTAIELPSREAMVERLGEPESWAGNCHGVSMALVELLGPEVATVRRGYFIGEVARGAYFDGRPCQHSWVELRDGRVIDPTRFAFTREPAWPLRVIGASLAAAEYDIGGCKMASASPPAPDVLESERELIELELESVDYVRDLLGLPDGFYGEGWLQLSLEQAHWLANLPIKEGREQPGTLSPFFAPEVYEALMDAGQDALIPIDRRDWMLPERSEGRVSF
jgi:hypothetical protein